MSEICIQIKIAILSFLVCSREPLFQTKGEYKTTNIIKQNWL